MDTTRASGAARHRPASAAAGNAAAAAGNAAAAAGNAAAATRNAAAVRAGAPGISRGGSRPISSGTCCLAGRTANGSVARGVHLPTAGERDRAGK